MPWEVDTTPAAATTPALPGARNAAPVADPSNALPFDERPVQARGSYNLDFFDGDNEYESYGLERMQRDEQRFQEFFTQYVAHLNSDFVTDDDFDREWTYERMLELDEALVRRGGLSATTLKTLLKPVRGIRVECAICMEQSTPRDKMARLVCTHAFHCACLQTWLAEKHTCPLCRHDLRTERDTGVREADEAALDADSGGDNDGGGEVDDGTDYY